MPASSLATFPLVPVNVNCSCPAEIEQLELESFISPYLIGGNERYKETTQRLNDDRHVFIPKSSARNVSIYFHRFKINRESARTANSMYLLETIMTEMRL